MRESIVLIVIKVEGIAKNNIFVVLCIISMYMRTCRAKKKWYVWEELRAVQCRGAVGYRRRVSKAGPHWSGPHLLGLARPWRGAITALVPRIRHRGL